MIGFYESNKTPGFNDAEKGYLSFLEGNKISGEVWSSNPLIVLATNEKVNKLYYPVYNSDASKSFLEYLQDSSNIEYVFMDNCGGGIICPACEPPLHNMLPISNGTIRLFQQARSLSLLKLSRLYFSRDSRDESHKLFTRFLEYHMGRRPRSLDVLEQL